MPDPRQLPALLRLFDDESEVVRRSVLDALAAHGEALEQQLRALPDAPDDAVVGAVLEAVADHTSSAGGVDTATDKDDDAPAGAPADASRAPNRPRRRAPRREFLLEEGQLVRHKRYGYRGVIVSRDATCRASDDWYEANRTRPPRDQPWYHVLVDGASHVTYAAQTSLLPDEAMRAVEHPLVPFFFQEFADGRYVRNERAWPTLES